MCVVSITAESDFSEPYVALNRLLNFEVQKFEILGSIL